MNHGGSVQTSIADHNIKSDLQINQTGRAQIKKNPESRLRKTQQYMYNQKAISNTLKNMELLYSIANLYNNLYI